MTNQAKELFAAANSGQGFANFYTQVFEREEIEHRYLIKGGPGTGKSTLMREIARQATDAGLEVEYYRCSSDPSSLDGLIVAGRIAVMDATSPHCVEPTIAGAKDELVDLGAFWSTDGLGKELEEIKKLSAQKSDCYGAAYAYLQGALALDERSRVLGAAALNNAKMHKAADRIFKKIKGGKQGKLKVGIIDSIGMKGRYRLSTYEENAQTVYCINDFLMTGSLFLARIAEQAIINGNSIRISYNPLNPKHPDAVLFENEKIAFIIGDFDLGKEKMCVKINMKRFVQNGGGTSQKERTSRIKREYRVNRRICNGLVRAAQDELANAGKYHFALEEIYKKYMDFEGEAEFANILARRVISMADKK